MNGRPVIAVVGSLNVDQTFRVARIPVPGETVAATGAFVSFGGKGANQAVAAARAGAEVRLIGCVGRDDQGTRYLGHLRAEGIDTGGIARVDAPTGTAFIAVDDAGENCIVVYPGANRACSPAHVAEVADRIRSAHALLLQLECPLDSVVLAARIAREAGVPVLVNPSPWQDAFRDAECPCDTFIVNEGEAIALTGGHPERWLSRRGYGTLVITRGARATRVLSVGEDAFELAPPKVRPVDTVGAGDTFAGAFATARAEGRSLSESVAFANAAAALSTLSPGAQIAIPTRGQVAAFRARPRRL